MRRRLWFRSDHAALVVGGLTIAALVLRAPQIHQSLFADELFAFDEIAGRSLRATVTIVATGLENSPPLFFVLAWASAKLGDPTVWIRLPSLLSGVALVPVTYTLGRQTVGRVAGVLGAGVVSLAPFAIEYSIEARPYMTLALLTALSTICLLRALESDRTVWWVAYALSSCAAVYTHYTAVLVLGGQVAWALWASREHASRLLVANVAALLLFLPFVPHVFSGSKPQLLNSFGEFTVSPPVLARAVAGIVPGSPFTPLSRLPGALASVAFAGGVGLALMGAAARRSPRTQASSRSTSVLVLILVPAVLAGLLVLSVVVAGNLFGPRNAITALPYLALSIGWLLVRSGRTVGVVAGALIAGSLAVGALDTIGPAGQRPPYRDAARAIRAQWRPGDVVLEREVFPVPGALSAHLAIYLPPRIPHLREGRDEARAWAAARRGGRVLFVQVIAPSTPRGRLPRTLGPDRLVLVARRLFPGFLPVSVATYRRAGPARR